MRLVIVVRPDRRFGLLWGRARPDAIPRPTAYPAAVPSYSPDLFDARYYHRFYRDPRTRAVSRVEMSRRAALVAAFCRHNGLAVRTILDLGCGLGLMRPTLLEQFPRARYTGVEVSAHLCERHGWEQASAHTYESPRPFDLVICYDVLQYLDDRDAARALRNFGRLCRGVLHFGALTAEDWEFNCDQSATDRNAHLRPAAWYRRRLAPNFANAGSGMFIRRGAPVLLWELEHAEPRRARRAG
jgi:predicted TPR repeat methyltransferase